MTSITLSSDILFFHILPRLPEKSIHRFLCVCKQWQSFLTTPIFAKMHYHHHKVLLILLSTKTPCTFRTIDCESPEDGLSTVSRPLPFSHENMSIVASVRGVVCVRIINKYYQKEYSDLILWNPSTGEYKTLSRLDKKKCFVTNAKAFGLYYSFNDYKILLVTKHRDIYIYSLKSDSWSKAKTTREDLELLSSYHWFWKCWEQPCVLLNEKLYFLIQQINTNPIISSRYSIIRFDLKTEKLRKIRGPSIGPDLDMTWRRCLSFTAIRGCIHLYLRRWSNNLEPTCLGRSVIEVWRMDGDGDGNGNWTNMVNYYRPPFPWFYHQRSILHLMKNGNWLVYYESGIYKVNIEKNITENMCSSDSIIIHTGGKYMETLGINLFNKH